MNDIFEELDKKLEELNNDGTNIFEVYKDTKLFNIDNNINIKLIISNNFQTTKLYKYILAKTCFLEKPVPFSFRLICIKNNIKSNPLCPGCSKILHYQKKRKNFQKYCSSKCANNDPIIKTKIKETLYNRYGVTNIMYLDKTKDKIKAIFNKKYGVDYPTQSPKIIQKRKENYFKKYGVYHHFQDKKYLDVLQHKFKEKYGVKTPLLFKSSREKLIEKQRTNIYYNTILKLDNVIPIFTLEDFLQNGANNIYLWKCSLCNKKYNGLYYSGLMKTVCPYCFPNKYGKSEQEINNYISSIYNKDIISNSKSIIPPKELDIYLPDINLAIEYNGLYWHSNDRGTDQYYHYNKTKECENKSIRLIHIFENEWINFEDIVKQKLKSLINNSASILSYNIVKNKINITINDLKFSAQIYKDKVIINNLFNYEEEVIRLIKSEFPKLPLLIYNSNNWCRKLDYPIIFESEPLKHFINNKELIKQVKDRYSYNYLWDSGYILYRI